MRLKLKKQCLINDRLKHNIQNFILKGNRNAIIFKYFFFIAVLFGIINGVILKSKTTQFINENPQYKEESNNVFIGYTLSLSVPFLILGMIQILGNFDSPFYIFSRNISNIFVLLSWLTLICSWALLFYWTFFKEGAKILIRYNIFGGSKPSSEVFVKFYVILMLLGGIAGLIIGSVMNTGSFISF